MYASVVVVGRCTHDVEHRVTPGGTSVAEVSVAVNRRRKRGDAWEDETTFLDVVAFGYNADKLRDKGGKGRRLLVAGDLRQEFWLGKDGSQRSRLRVVASAVHALDRNTDPAEAPKAPTGDELPF